MKKTTRITDDTDQFMLPATVLATARAQARQGERVLIGPDELVNLLLDADTALNGSSNDAEHDMLYAIRETLSDMLEDPDRRHQVVRMVRRKRTKRSTRR